MANIDTPPFPPRCLPLLVHRAITALPTIRRYFHVVPVCWLAAAAASGSDQADQPGASPASVALSASQIGAITIAPVVAADFPIECTEIGAVATTQDPVLVQAESNLLAAAATRELTTQERQRAQGLAASHSVSQRELEQATADQQTADAALQVARVALLALGETDQDVQRLIMAGHIATPPPVAAARWVTAAVLETDVPLVRVGQTVSVGIPALPDTTFTGSVRTLYDLVDPTTHRMTIRCLVSDGAHQLTPGLLAVVTIRIQDGHPAPAIPANGVIREGDGTWTAWVTTDHSHFSQRTITPGRRAHGLVQILSGAAVGEQVVTDGALLLDNMLNAPPQD